MSPNEPHPGSGHRGRLRDRFLEHGLDKFTDEEVLELLLTLATPRRDCKQQARQLMGGLKSLPAVLDAEPEVLAKVKGIGPKNILGLKLIPAVARRYLEAKQVKAGLAFDYGTTCEYLRITMSPLTREVFRVMLLDGKNMVLESEDLSAGTADMAVVFPREVVAKSLAVQARSVVCAHNHPGGDPTPSRDDIELTRQLYFALKAVRVELKDHLVVGRDRVYSLARGGEMEGIAAEYAAMGLG